MHVGVPFEQAYPEGAFFPGWPACFSENSPYGEESCWSRLSTVVYAYPSVGFVVYVYMYHTRALLLRCLYLACKRELAARHGCESADYVCHRCRAQTSKQNCRCWSAGSVSMESGFARTGQPFPAGTWIRWPFRLRSTGFSFVRAKRAYSDIKASGLCCASQTSPCSRVCSYARQLPSTVLHESVVHIHSRICVPRWLQ